MNTPATRALSKAEVTQILRAAEGIAILVGGQALALWGGFYQVTFPAGLTRSVTRDIDFIGSADAALIVKDALSDENWQFVQLSVDERSPVTAQLTLESPGGIKEIDFLAEIVGLRTEDLRKRVVTLRLEGGVVAAVLHPLDVLASRLQNLAELASNGTP